MGQNHNGGKSSVRRFNLCIWKPAGFSFALGNNCFRNQPVRESLRVGVFFSLLSKKVVLVCDRFGVRVRLSSHSSPGVRACPRSYTPV